jgi:spore coat protein U-like protein
MRVTTGLSTLDEMVFVGEPTDASTSISESVQYKLCKDSGHATDRGETVGSDVANGIRNGASQSGTVCGHVPPPTLGSYLDAMTVTVTY